jgi:hypothetical protein
MQRDVQYPVLKGQSLNSVRLIFISFSLLLVAHVMLCFAGFYNGDDINFARYAGEIKNFGISSAKAVDHFQLRWTPIWFTAFFYSIFGVNDISSALYALGCMLGCGWLIYRMQKNEGWKVCLFTCALFFLGRSVLFYSHRLLADPGICLAVLTMYYACRNLQHRNIAGGFLFAFAFICAVMTKESIIIALPFFGLLFCNDLLKKRALQFWFFALFFSGIFSLIYLSYFRFTTGDWFFRYHLLYQNSYKNICSFDQLPASATLRRIGYQLWQAMLLNGDLIVLIPGIAAIFYLPAKAQHRKDLFAFTSFLLLANFMTISWSSYVPLCHDPRHFLFIMPFAALTGGRMLALFVSNPSQYRILPVLYVLATIVIFLSNTGSTKYLYLACSLLTVAVTLLPRLRMLMIPGFIVVFALNYVIDFIKPFYPFHDDNRFVARELRNHVAKKSFIYSRGFAGEMAEYFLGFPPGEYQFKSIDSMPESFTRNAAKQYFLLDGKNDLLTKEEVQAFPGAQLIVSRNQAALFTGNAEFFKHVSAFYRDHRSRSL